MEHFIGIDLGTTYSAISTIDSYGKPIVLKNSEGENLTPSAVYFAPNGNILVGSEAKDMMQNAGAEVAVFFKRFMGDKTFSYDINGRRYSATDLSALLLDKLRRDAELALGGSVRKAVITVPAYFNDLQRTETVKAAKQAGLDVLRIINEPTAAAITYGINQQKGSRMLVYDLGGGTFDVTVLEVGDGTMHVLATGGDHKLGGKDWDDCIVNYVADKFECEHGCNPLDDTETFNDLLFSAEMAKKQLSSTTQATINIRYNGCRGRYVITRDMFQQLTAHLMHNTQQKTEEVLREAGLSWRELDGVLLVGGSTKMTIVSDWVRQMSGKEPLRGVNVDEAVCIGAGIQASLDMQNQAKRFGLPGSTSQHKKFALPGGDICIQDVMSHSLGAIAVSEDGSKYVNSIIIPKNRTIPVTETRPFQLPVRKADQEMELYLTQGETSNIEDVTVVGYYVIRDMTPMQDAAIINVSYIYDENGIINVEATQNIGSSKTNLTVEKRDLPSEWSWLHKKPKGKNVPLSIIIAIDMSGSMIGTPIKKAREAAMEFIRRLADNCPDLGDNRIGVMGFADQAELVCENTNDISLLKKSISKMDTKLFHSYPDVGGGNDNNPLEDAYKAFSYYRKTNKKILVVLTDGVWSYPGNAIKWSDRYRNEEMDIIAVGFGGADEEFLKRISTSSGSALLTDLDHLVESFGNIAQELSNNGSASAISFK